ncbi:MAG TPA: hypothetical protein VNO32_09430, partial [Candidatus Acidoferrum sp.]|nr:hypothetical protein [Candidatus Acidoferrum sp.]
VRPEALWLGCQAVVMHPERQRGGGKADSVEAPPSAAAIFRKFRRRKSFRRVILFPPPFV